MKVYPEFVADVRELVRLVTGLESGYVTCACRRVYRVGVSKELEEVLKRVRPALEEDEPIVPATSRFSLLEVD